ncbi:unnamed protein product [Diamesa hyperborea]
MFIKAYSNEAPLHKLPTAYMPWKSSALLGKKSPLPGVPGVPNVPDIPPPDDAEGIALDTVFDRDVDTEE